MEIKDGELPEPLRTDLSRAARRVEAMTSRVQDLKQEAELAAKDAHAIRRQQLGIKPKEPLKKVKED